MKVRFSLTALLYLRSERDYIARFNPRAAAAVVQQIRKAADMLGNHPSIGAVTSVPRVRRYVSGPYHIDYLREEGSIVIVAIRHGRQAEIDMEGDADFEMPEDT